MVDGGKAMQLPLVGIATIQQFASMRPLILAFLLFVVAFGEVLIACRGICCCVVDCSLLSSV